MIAFKRFLSSVYFTMCSGIRCLCKTLVADTTLVWLLIGVCPDVGYKVHLDPSSLPVNLWSAAPQWC